ncbi:hypothetical protein F5X98DRAFT_358747 [Xylaria grammica]|nr:hypothetical protein F5X98DRAFT_358747 [Xylaria grammica]
MAPAIVTDDYYAILGVVMTADTQAIRTAYRRLARITHPDKNPSPNGKEEFQRLQAAYETLSDATKRRAYDFTRPKPSTSYPAASPASKDTPQRESDKTAQTTAQEANRAREKALEILQAQWARRDMDLFEARRNVRKLEADITKLQEEETADAREPVKQAGWWESVTSVLFRVSPAEANASREIREEKERRRLNRRAAIRIKSMEMLHKTNKLSILEVAARGLATEIAELKQQIRAEEQRQEAERRAEAQRKMWEESMRRMREAEAQRQRQREEERERKEQERKKREQEESERKERERKERERKVRERLEREQKEREQQERELMERKQRDFPRWKEDMVRKERERVDRQRQEQQKKPAESRKRASKQQQQQQQQQQHGANGANGAPNSAKEPQGACLHAGWWSQIPGRAVCSVCSKTLVRFALECPSCQVKACVSCKRAIQGGKR